MENAEVARGTIVSIFMLALESEQAEDLHVPCQEGEQRQKSSGHHREGGAQQGQGTSPCLPMSCCVHAGGQGQDPSGHLQSNGTEGAAVWALSAALAVGPLWAQGYVSAWHLLA